MENLADIYYKKVIESERPAYELMEFYCKLYKRPVNKSDLKLFEDLVQIFGRTRVYNGIIELKLVYSEMKDTVELPKILKRILKSFISNRVVSEGLQYSQDLTDYAKNTRELIENAKNNEKIKIPDIFEDKE